MSESEFFEAGMSLPPAVRRQVALRLLDSLEDVEDAVERATESWMRTEVATAYDAFKADPSRAIPAPDVRAHFESTWAARS